MKDNPTYIIESGHSIPENRGRKRYNETHIVDIAIKGLISGQYRSCRNAATKLKFMAELQTGTDETKIERLRHKIGQAWKICKDNPNFKA